MDVLYVVVMNTPKEKWNVRTLVTLMRTSKRFAFLRSDLYWKHQIPTLHLQCPKLKFMSDFVVKFREAKEKSKSDDDIYFGFGFSLKKHVPLKRYFPKKKSLVEEKVYKRLSYLWKFMQKNKAIKKKHDKYNNYLIKNTGKILCRRPIGCAACGEHCNGKNKIQYNWLELKRFCQGFSALRSIPMHNRNMNFNDQLSSILFPSKLLPFCSNCITQQNKHPRKWSKAELKHRKWFFLKKRIKSKYSQRFKFKKPNLVPYFKYNCTIDHYYECDNPLLEWFLSRFY